MGWWSDRVLPRMIDRGMRNDVMAEKRGRAAPLATGRVLELGAGSGLNIPLYTSAVEHLFALEPSAYLREQAAELADAAAFGVDMLAAGAESIPLERHEIDTVVSSWTLCSVPDLDQALQEVRRVLKPNGRFIFLEHGRAPDEKLSRWQDRLLPLTTPLLGCALNRKIDDRIKAAGFEFAELETAYLEGPRIISYHYIGEARPT